MRKNKIFYIFLLCTYVAITLFVGLGHNHREDFDFHENCPACQWGEQAQDNDETASAAISALFHPLVCTGQVLCEKIRLPLQERYFSTEISRAPPSSL